MRGRRCTCHPGACLVVSRSGGPSAERPFACTHALFLQVSGAVIESTSVGFSHLDGFVVGGLDLEAIHASGAAESGHGGLPSGAQPGLWRHPLAGVPSASDWRYPELLGGVVVNHAHPVLRAKFDEGSFNPLGSTSAIGGRQVAKFAPVPAASVALGRRGSLSFFSDGSHSPLMFGQS